MKLEWVEECKACHGTGVYVGMAERKGAGIVCNGCKGTGRAYQHVEYTEFTGRRHPIPANHIYACNPGIVVDGVGTVPGGVSVEEWLANPESVNAPGREMREHTCPAWWYQSADWHKKPDWKECGFGIFSRCQYFPQKAACWERWDEELGDKRNGGE